ncbi:multidrug effflux MFS transporter [Aestuariivirga sp.]|uniref:multidrug effflux MFS transporter n=1 Tax=Aestuariivirga sp. TaxID=2650926 RepID=UPI0039196CD7
MTKAAGRISFEFIVLVALLNAMVAMSIDTMLPAIGAIAAELGAADANSRQYIITVFFAGLTLGTLVYGPWSDSLGRKPTIVVGLCFYALGALLCLAATSFPMMLAGRFIQGFGASAPRIVSIAMVRDGQGGAAMARVMSFVMMVFMLVPILAPSIGQLVLLVASWRMIFLGLLGMGVIAGLWLWFRQEETLPRERRSPLSPGALLAAAVEVLRHPVAMGYTLASGAIFGSFISYLGTSQQIFAEQYGQGAYFALWFALFAGGIAIAMMVNARLVMRYGMRRLSALALRGFVGLAVAFLAASLLLDGHPPLWSLAAYLFLTFFCSGLLFGNFNAIAMEPMGRIAGMAAAISGALSSLVAILTGGYIGQLYDGTLIPLVAGFAGLGLIALASTEWAERRRR